MQQKRAELVKRRDRLDKRITSLDLQIARHPEDCRRYDEEQAKGTWLSQFLSNPRIVR
jgi:hypothetical protein